VADIHTADVLVLGGGGILGEAWMTAVLAGLAEAAGFDARRCEAFVGTSAGSIVAAALVAGIEPLTRLGALPEQPAVPDAGPAAEHGLLARALKGGMDAGGTAAAPLVAVGLRVTEASGARLRRAALRRIPPGRRPLSRLGQELEQAGASFDGRLMIAAVDVETGRRVMFGAADAPRVPLGAAVEASCAIPGVFRPVVVDGRAYVDGGVWSPTNLDRAPAGSGTQVLCLNPTGSMRPNLAMPVGALSRSVAAVEALVLERRGARVTTVSPDAAARAAMGTNLMDAGPRSRVIAAGLAQGRKLGAGADRHAAGR
jgi:NTE family protein